jgi:hypothetical protein
MAKTSNEKAEKVLDKTVVKEAEIQQSIKEKEKAVRENKTIQKNG